MAERMGFEPMIEFPLYTLSKRAPSTTRPPLQNQSSFLILCSTLKYEPLFNKNAKQADNLILLTLNLLILNNNKLKIFFTKHKNINFVIFFNTIDFLQNLLSKYRDDQVKCHTLLMFIDGFISSKCELHPL